MDNALLLHLKKIEKNMSDEFDDVLSAINSIQLRVDDIYFGNQISEWVADLADSGKLSSTYSDFERMNTLIANKDACKNIVVNQHILDWGIENNKVGTFFNSYIGVVSGVTWNSIASINQLCSSSSAFSVVATNSEMFNLVLNNSTARNSIFDNYATTQSILKGSAPLGVLKSRQQTYSYTKGTYSIKLAVFEVYTNCSNNYLTHMNGNRSYFGSKTSAQGGAEYYLDAWVNWATVPTDRMLCKKLELSTSDSSDSTRLRAFNFA